MYWICHKAKHKTCFFTLFTGLLPTILLPFISVHCVALQFKWHLQCFFDSSHSSYKFNRNNVHIIKNSKDIVYFLFKRVMNENMHSISNSLKALWFAIKYHISSHSILHPEHMKSLLFEQAGIGSLLRWQVRCQTWDSQERLSSARKYSKKPFSLFNIYASSVQRATEILRGHGDTVRNFLKSLPKKTVIIMIFSCH